jgi:hypothetical protein
MLKKACFGAVFLAAAAVSTTAMADDRGVNTAVGALVGAAIGGSAGGRDGALVGGVLGAAVGSSVRTGDDDHYRGRGYVSGGYVSSGYAPVYSESYDAPAPVYVESRPVYVPPARYYYRDRPDVVIVEHGRGYGRGYDHDYDRDYDRDYYRGCHHGDERGYDRGYDHGWRR